MADVWRNNGRIRFKFSLQAAMRATFKLIGYAGEAKISLVPISDLNAPSVGRSTVEPFGVLDPAETWRRAAQIADQSATRRAEGDDYCLSFATEIGLASHPTGLGWSFFASSRSAQAKGQRIFAAVALRDEELSCVPQLVTTLDDDDPLPSLVHAVVRNVLYRVGLLLASDPNHTDVHGLPAQAHEIVRTATANLVHRALIRDSSFVDHGLLLNSISALPYEGRAGSGTIVVVSPDSELAQIDLRLRSPIPIENVRAVRKLMEAATPRACLLLHDGLIHGIGTLNAAPLGPSEDPPVVFRIMGRGTWQLEQSHKALLQVRDGLSRLPSAATDMAVDEGELRERIAWLLPDGDVEALTRLAQSFVGSHHGAMLIISSHAAQEAARFGAQAFPVEPGRLTPEVSGGLAQMDGGVLVDQRGRCHAIGVLLDGHTGAREDPARGSRYNNAARYLALDGDPKKTPGSTHTIVIVYSADGMVDILPPLRRPQHATALHQLVDAFIEAVQAPTRKVLEIERALKQVDELRFYLSASQCSKLNDLLDTDGVWPVEIPPPRRFNPDPRMDPRRFMR